MKTFGLLIPLLGLVAAQRQVLVTYPDSTPPSIVEKAKEAVVAAGGKITEEFSLIKSFAATVSTDIVESINALSESHKPIVEDDGTVTIQQQAPLEQ
ncbi:MAG: hypothetical protein Q9174_003941 [Haloplaca sp. 1 TL-2023]